MALFEKFQQVDKRLAGSFVVTVVLTIASFIVGRLYDNKPRIRFQIISQAPVYDLREDVTTLDIFFEGKSIRQQQQTLSLITLKIENAGSADISKQMSFDESFLPGFKVTDAKIVKADITSSSSDYLRTSFNLARKADSEFTFGPCIIDKGDFVTVKILALHGEQDQPSLVSFGKIAGSSHIDVVTSPTINGKTGFWTFAFSGELTIQSVRLVGYSIAFLLLLLLIGSILGLLVYWISNAKRKKHAALYKRTLGELPSSHQQAVIDLYLDSGASSVVFLNELFSNSELLRTELMYWNRLSSGDVNRTRANAEFRNRSTLSSEILSLVRRSTKINDDGTVTVDGEYLKAAREFETFLLHQVPEKIKEARGQTQPEPFGTESHTSLASSTSEPSVQPSSNA